MRFITEDSYKGDIKDPLSLNYYAYAYGNPLSYTDPSGHSPESREQAKKIIIENKIYIKQASEAYSVDPSVVAGVIFAENSLNVDFKDKLTDWLGFYGIDTSIGIGQVRMSTAKNLEEKNYISKVKDTEGGWNLPLIGFIHGTENMAREKRLEDNKLNTLYVAAYIRLIIDTWKDKFESIDESPEILGTLYNIGHDSSEPHPSPGANEFGEYVGENYNEIDETMNQSE